MSRDDWAELGLVLLQCLGYTVAVGAVGWALLIVCCSVPS